MRADHSFAELAEVEEDQVELVLLLLVLRGNNAQLVWKYCLVLE